MNTLKQKLFLLVTLISFSSFTWANNDMAIIVNPDSGISEANKTEIVNLFLKKSKSLKGTKFVPYDLDKGQTARTEFYSRLVRKNESQLKAYWSRLIFTGKGLPPTAFSSEQDILNTVANDKSAIGYISKSKVNSSVKVLMQF